MERKIFGQKVVLEQRGVHVAPSGSVRVWLQGPHDEIAGILDALREEIAYGMIDIDNSEKGATTLRVEIYFGSADRDDFSRIMNSYGAHVQTTESALAEETVGLTMQSRNQVIERIG